jgi:hypothetical protein
MLKRKLTDGPFPVVKAETGGLADTNCGVLLRDIVATRSWIIVISAILIASFFFRAAIGLGGYSGMILLQWLLLCRIRDSAYVW